MIKMASAVVIVNTKGKILILKRSGTKKIHSSMWNLPSGAVEKDESASDAALREVFEETGIKLDEIKHSETKQINIDKGFTLEINFFLAKTKENNVILNEENSEYKWVTPLESLDYNFAIPKEEVSKLLQKLELLKSDTN